MIGFCRFRNRLIPYALAAACSLEVFAAERYPSWLIGMEEITRLPDPFDTSQIAKIEGWPSFGEPRCVTETRLPKPNRKCWAQTTGAGNIRRATLEYYSDPKGNAQSKMGTLNVELARQPCTTVEQAESIFQTKIRRKLGPEPRSAESAGTAYYQIRLFGAAMQPLTIDFVIGAGCITAATLSR
jgi:hypothetical protein